MPPFIGYRIGETDTKIKRECHRTNLTWWLRVSMTKPGWHAKVSAMLPLIQMKTLVIQSISRGIKLLFRICVFLNNDPIVGKDGEKQGQRQ